MKMPIAFFLDSATSEWVLGKPPIRGSAVYKPTRSKRAKSKRRKRGKK